MKKINLFTIIVALIVVLSACNQKSSSFSNNAEVSSEADSVALSVGYTLGGNLKKQFGDVNPELIAQGIIAAFNDEKNPLFEKDQEADMAIRAYLRKESERAAEENLKAGQKFLEENAKREGVTVTESGLQYEVIKEGEGEKPTAASTVEVHYHGTTIDGKVFDSSVERGETIEFPLNGVIKGWTEGLQLMSVGSKYKLFIPSDLAYGERGGAGGGIQPNSALIFEVELISIVE
ncbi:MAG: FKBP-type peptidyl-prolyl cis-trans isomerase [Prolixibacteraceae bacterium]|jgi:FKBP-type peptidyl-prolyl cis-trans isomerase|nr:FKBP-type peptidyl-prolyl cis-trans isomerase [Prolixibacteraceae bacterium]